MSVVAGPIRVSRLDAAGCPTGETVEVDVFDITIEQKTSDADDQVLYSKSALGQVGFTVDFCWRKGGKREFIETVAGVDYWKQYERTRKRYAHRARKVKRRQR